MGEEVRSISESVPNVILELYTDGSYSKSNPNVVTGGIVILNNGKPVAGQRSVSKLPSMTSMNNVGGELVSAISGMALCYTFLKSTSKLPDKDVTGVVKVFHDYKGIELFIQGSPKWKATKPGAVMYVTAVTNLMIKYPKVKLQFVKVKAHTGNKWNEVVDRIAAGEIPAELKNLMLRENVS